MFSAKELQCLIQQLLIANPTLENFSDLIPVPAAMELTCFLMHPQRMLSWLQTYSFLLYYFLWYCYKYL